MAHAEAAPRLLASASTKLTTPPPGVGAYNSIAGSPGVGGYKFVAGSCGRGVRPDAQGVHPDAQLSPSAIGVKSETEAGICLVMPVLQLGLEER